MTAAASTSERYRPEVVARLLELPPVGEVDAQDAAHPPPPARRGAATKRALTWLGGAALVAGLAGLGAWSAPSQSASAAPPPRVEVPEIVVVASAPSAAPTAPAPEPERASMPPPSGVLADGRVVLNVATEEELTRLPSVGPSRAKAIVALRARLGKFRQMSELLRVKGIGRKTLAKLAPKVVLDPPAT